MSDSPAMTPIEEIRGAAELMRARVQGTTEGPWWLDLTTTHTAIRGPGRRGSGRPSMVAYTSGTRFHGLADGHHIASWHPGVALAVADWLDDEAIGAQTLDGEPTAHALTVARAYLGGQP